MRIRMGAWTLTQASAEPPCYAHALDRFQLQRRVLVSVAIAAPGVVGSRRRAPRELEGPRLGCSLCPGRGRRRVGSVPLGGEL